MPGGVGPREILTHSQRVCRLYKKAYRTMESWAVERYHFRFNAVVLRARFDESRSIKDIRILAQMLEDGEKECWREQHYDPSIFKGDPGGIVYSREAVAPDWVMDQWHPWEKVQTLDVCQKREQLKKEFNEYYEKSLTKKYQPETPAPVS